MILGAGVPLNFNLPDSIIKPSTDNITKEVIRPYHVYSLEEADKTSNVINDIYTKLTQNYPLSQQQGLDWRTTKPYVPNIHFEILFHVLEMYIAYKPAWDGNCHNGDIYPYFALFSKDSVNYPYNELFSIKRDFITRIMDIVSKYDEYYRQNKNDKEKWYAEFFQLFKNKLEIFNFNYDTTIEESIGEFEDGFEDNPNSDGLKIFNPNKLWNNKKNLSTINHIHGCILYYQAKNDEDRYGYDMLHDMYNYPNYASMRNRYVGTGHSEPVSQDHTEYIAGPIITGLRKTEKINCIPYEFYYGHLFNSIIKNNSIIIAGYSFGDKYTNQLLLRMGILHGDMTRIVLIDYWKYDTKSYDGLEYFLNTQLSGDLISFLLMTAQVDSISAFCKDIDNSLPYCLKSSNGRLMIFVSGFKEAARHKKTILSFVNSNRCNCKFRKSDHRR